MRARIAIVSIIVGCLSIAPGCCCRTTRGTAVRTQTEPWNAYVEKLSTSDVSEYSEAYESLFAAGIQAVPVLLENAENPAPVNWSPPLYPTSSLPPVLEDASVGHVCLYLLEGIRLNLLVHSDMFVFWCPGHRPQDAAYAAAEYRHWWASLVQGDDPPYTPDVRWRFLSKEGIASYEGPSGRKIQFLYMPVPRRDGNLPGS